MPGTVIAPVGQGGLLLGLIRGFESLITANILQKLPYFVGVQANNCSPILRAFLARQGNVKINKWTSSIAEGVCVSLPVRGDALLKVFKRIQAKLLAFMNLTSSMLIMRSQTGDILSNQLVHWCGAHLEK